MLTSRVTSQAEPWNVEGVTITGKGIEVLQYAGYYNHNDMQVGPRVLAKDEIAWSVLFRQGSMKDIRLREMSKLPTTKAKTPSTFIEIIFKYEGVPESKDATQLKTVGPEEAEGMYVSGSARLKLSFLLDFCLSNQLQLLGVNPFPLITTWGYKPSPRPERLLSCSELSCCFGKMT